MTRFISTGSFPPAKVNVLRWDATPDGWGILIAEAEDASAYFQALNLWRTAGAGFFKYTKTAPALPVQEAMAAVDEMMAAMRA